MAEGLALKTLAMVALRRPYREATKKNMPKRWFGSTPHSHVAVDDAIGQGEMFCNILAEIRRVAPSRSYRAMRVLGIDHINIAGSSELIARCRSFYVDVLGLTDGHRPPFRSRGFWLYAGDRAVVHLTERESTKNGGGAFNHLAFTCDGLDTAAVRLKKHGVTFEIDEVPLSKQTQIFLTDPAGVALELNFATR